VLLPDLADPVVVLVPEDEPDPPLLPEGPLAAAALPPAAPEPPVVSADATPASATTRVAAGATMATPATMPRTTFRDLERDDFDLDMNSPW
jgi:hypothetical protein